MTPKFLLGRLIDLAFVMFGVSVIVFLMIRLIPGDAVTIMLGANTEITPERVETEQAPRSRSADGGAVSGLDRRRAARQSGHLDLDRACGDPRWPRRSGRRWN